MKTSQKRKLFFNFQLLALLLIIAMITACSNKAKTGDEATGEVKESAKSEQKAPAEKKLPFERGSYVQETKTMGMEVTNTTYFDRWGDWTASENKQEMKIGGQTIKIHKRDIVKGNKHWNLDLIEKTGTTFELNLPPGMAAMMGAALGGAMMEGMEIKELGEEEYLGYKCKKTNVKHAESEMDITTLSYGNLQMKSDGKMGQMKISTRVVSIDLSAPPAAMFEIPADIKIESNQY